MKVLASNPLVKDTADKVFCLAREHFNVENDDKLFAETVVMCFLEGQENETRYLSDWVWLAMQEKKLVDFKSRKRASVLLQRFLSEKERETVDFYSGDEKGNVASFDWIAFKVKDFDCDMEKKYIKFDLLRLVANIIRVFSNRGIVKKESKLFGIDLKSVYLKAKEMLTMTGTFNRVWSKDDLDE